MGTPWDARTYDVSSAPQQAWAKDVLSRLDRIAPDATILDVLFPADRAAPIVTVQDGHPHTLSFVSTIRCVPIACLGVTDFGQSGDIGDLYRYFGIDAETIVGATVDLLETSCQ